jgi:hypothetical protein
MNEDRMRELYARNSARRAASDPPCDVSLEAMIDVLEQRGPEEERRRVLAEILRSPACREEFELLRAVVRASRPVRAPVASTVWRWAAALVVAVGLGLVVTLWRGQPPEPLRGGSSPIMLADPAEGARLSAPPAFAWRGVPGALEYRLELLSDSGRVVFSATVQDTTLGGPATLAPGRYLWQVIARLGSGEAVRSSTRHLTVEPPR